MSDTYVVTRTETIKAPAAAIYRRIADFHEWPAWSPWEDLDPDMKRRYAGAESGVGAKYGWSGNRKAGEGRMEIVEAVDPDHVKVALRFLKPFKSTSSIDFDLAEDGEATHVTWTMTGDNTLMLKIMGIFRSMDKMIGPDFEKGLAQLKAVAEASD